MAIAKAGQASYDDWGDEFLLSEEFLKTDFRTWDQGEVSINHQNNNNLIGNATLYDLEYDPETTLVFASFANLPDKARNMIFSEFYEGLSQECLPIKVKGNEVVRGHGLGVTIVTYPWSPAATQGDGVGIPPAVSIRLAASFRKYDDYQMQMQNPANTQTNQTGKTNSTGGNTTTPDPEPTPVTEPKPVQGSTELQSARTEITELKSTNQKLTSENEVLKADNEALKKQATMNQTQIESAVNAALESERRQRVAQQEHDDAANELKSYMAEDIYVDYLKSEPTTQAIKSMTATLKKTFSGQVGAGSGKPPEYKAPSEQKSKSFNPRSGAME
ncbi:hypothetical protein [Methanosarcina sp.]|uniref:hypothetical protein n=1 Tax=Methanosarcina sp. TaxID=2213 RepID=UPI003BB6A8AF